MRPTCAVYKYTVIAIKQVTLDFLCSLIEGSIEQEEVG